ncbi:MAG: aminoacyl-tRNA hydrolase [Ectothiorhodospiraceae bacterium]|nr:aminoacyl-tRNA hydrolase [Ectothiorhodospiraceae bacterium]
MSSCVQLIVGLGNPGPKYQQTRHNVGFIFVDELARSKGASFKLENKFHGDVCKLSLSGNDVWLLKPNTFMNLSGKAVAALARFYKIEPESVLLVHDELDIPPGQLRLKKGGGHGGHNGLRDTIAQLGSKEFMRLRVGIGHPGNSRDVSNYVLGKAPQDEQIDIDAAMDEAMSTLPQILEGEMQAAMNRLHSRK